MRLRERPLELKPKKSSKNVAKAGKDVVETAESTKPLTLKTLVAVLIVNPPLLLIAQHIVSFCSFLELVLGRLCPRGYGQDEI